MVEIQGFLNNLITTLNEQIKKTNELVSDTKKGIDETNSKLERIIYLLETNTEHEFLTFNVTTQERNLKFSRGAYRRIIVFTGAAVWIDFDRKAEVNISHLMAADSSLEIPLWVTEVHAVTAAGTANLKVIGLR